MAWTYWAATHGALPRTVQGSPGGGWRYEGTGAGRCTGAVVVGVLGVGTGFGAVGFGTVLATGGSEALWW
jgi:hypothetical protein